MSKLRLWCQNIFSAARHLQFGNLRARSDWAMEILLCSLIPYPRQRKQRKPNIIHPGVEYNGRRNGHVNATNTPRTFLCTLWVFEAHIGFVLRPMKWSESHRDESVSSQTLVQSNYACPKRSCQAEPNVRSMNTT